MAKQTVNIGSSANDGTGDTLRAGADKINDNTNEMYNAVGNGTGLKTLVNAGLQVDVHATGALYYAHVNRNPVIADISDGPILNYTHPGPQLLYATTASTNTSGYYFSGPGVDTGPNPNFTVYRGHTYIFDNTLNSGSHPFEIRVSAGGVAFTEGVSSPASGVTKFVVPHEPSDTALVYQCTVHSAMVGNITIV